MRMQNFWIYLKSFLISGEMNDIFDKLVSTVI